MVVTISMLALLLIGFQSLVTSRKEGFPEISLNRIVVRTLYPGASARDVESEVTDLIEEELQEVEGIKEILSYSEENISRIEVRGKEELKPEQFRRLYSDVENAIGRIDDLPDGIRGRPAIDDVTTADIPILEIAYSGSPDALTVYLEGLERRLRRIPGVSGIDISGLPDEEIHVLIDAALARKHHVDLRMISKALAQRNITGSGGILYNPDEEQKITISQGLASFDEILNTPILGNTDGFDVRLRDVARVERGREDVRLIVRNNGQNGAILSVRKSGQADLLDTVEKVHRLLESEELPDGVSQSVLVDQSTLTRDRISLLAGNAAMGFVLVLLVLMYFLDRTTALWTAFGIPVTLLGMIVFLKFNDISINLISLAGFIILIGMLVDDAVVIAEQYRSNRESGMEPREAATQSVTRMFLPVLASSATTMIAFAPLFMIGGFPGAFIWTIPLMIIVGLTISLLESFFFLPVHLAHARQRAPRQNRLMPLLERLYRKSLEFFIRHRYRAMGVFLLMLVTSLVALRLSVRKDPFPQDAADTFSISITLPAGTTTMQTQKEMDSLEAILRERVGPDLKGTSIRIGTQNEDSTVDRGAQSNLIVALVYLISYEERDRTAETIMNELHDPLEKMAKKNGMQFALNLKRLGPPMGRAIEIRLLSDDDVSRTAKARETLSFLEGIPGVTHVELDERDGLRETELVLNQGLLNAAGLHNQDILTSLRIALDGTIVSRIRESDMDIRLKLNRKINESGDFIKKIPVINRLGIVVPLERFVTAGEGRSPASITHVNAMRSTTVLGNVDNRIISPTDIMDIVNQKFSRADGVLLEFSGQPVETSLIFAGLSSASVVALIGIYLIIALIFNSYTKPFIILLSLPFMTIGIAFVLISHDVPGSMMVGVAVVGLMGVVVNASIVMVDTILTDTEAATPGELPGKQIVIEGAVSRLRPIVLTTATTVLGVLPTGYGIGGYDPFLSHMSLVLAYGLGFATIIILIIIPLLFMIGTDLRWMLLRRASVVGIILARMRRGSPDNRIHRQDVVKPSVVGRHTTRPPV